MENIFEFKPSTKDTSQKKTLISDSCHHPSIQLNWPKAELMRCARNSSRHIDFAERKKESIGQLRRYSSAEVLGSLERLDPFTNRPKQRRPRDPTTLAGAAIPSHCSEVRPRRIVEQHVNKLGAGHGAILHKAPFHQLENHVEFYRTTQPQSFQILGAKRKGSRIVN